ncbi:MAG: hypothetical protein HYV63_06110 [Candidatus Schekmanbacteria bacterium]|nr:hypothetical protein [Candidatus Schekmanbacteria bacterium]
MFRNVLIARPHPFIVGDMKPFLESAGYTTVKLPSLSNLRSQTATACGSVVSMAVASSIAASAEDVVAELRQVAPRLPVALAGLLELDQIRSLVERMGARLGSTLVVVGASAGDVNDAVLGTPNAFVYVSRSDLITPDRRAQATRVLQRHFH